MLVINAFNGLDGESIIDFSQNGSDLNFEAKGITAVKFEAGGAKIDCSISGNRITFKPGKLGLRPAIYQAKVVAISASKPNGEAIAGPGEDIEIELQYHA